jgi:2-keto-4-pentenoate hydratase/2-oxohepta-3-ene-1,7-dioic acid hydratase in catechol pathway
MRWCRFVSKDGPSFGIVEDDRIVPVEGDPFTRHKLLRGKVPLAGTKLLAPVDNPTYYAIGRNYQGHMEGRARSGAVFPKEPWAWWRAASAISGHDDDIVLPPDCPVDIEYECEPMVVLGKGGKFFTRKEAEEAIFGFTISNDVTEISWARQDPSSWRAKNCDTWKPIGTCRWASSFQVASIPRLWPTSRIAYLPRRFIRSRWRSRNSTATRARSPGRLPRASVPRTTRCC